MSSSNDSSKGCALRPDISFFRTITVCSYEDLDQVELEIRRVLRCSSQRVPVCMTTESYARFRCNILQHMEDETNKDEKQLSDTHDNKMQECVLQLTQSLVMKLSSSPSSSRGMQVHLGWEGLLPPSSFAFGQQGEQQDEAENGSSDDDERKRKIAAKRPRKQSNRKKSNEPRKVLMKK